jgi:hypothetical protein
LWRIEIIGGKLRKSRSRNYSADLENTPGVVGQEQGLRFLVEPEIFYAGEAFARGPFGYFITIGGISSSHGTPM